MISWRRLSFQRTTHATWTWCLTAQYPLPTFVTFSYFFHESWMTLSYFVQPRYHDAGYVALLRCSSSNVDKVLIPDCLNFINGGKATLWKQMSYAAVWIGWVEGKFQWLWPEREMRCVTWDQHVECVRITGSDLAKDAWCKEEQPGATACSLNKPILFVWSQASTGCLPFRSTVSWGTLNQSLYTRLRTQIGNIVLPRPSVFTFSQWWF